MKISHDRKSIFLASILISLVAVFIPLSPSLKAQSFYGNIVGTVTDSSGAVVPNASITLTNTGTNEKRTTQTDSLGNYRFVELLPAMYQVDMAATGYKHFSRSSIPVKVDNSVRIDIPLELGSVTESVVVTAAPPLIQTDSGTLGSEVDGEQVQAMPLNGRNPMNLIALVPGVVPQGQSSGSTAMNGGNHTQNAGWGNYQIGGGIAGQSAEYIDGASINVFGNTVGLVPTQDVIQEFKVATNAVSAEFGRFAGGVVEMTTKSGSNAWHGTAYEYLRNKVFNANDFFSKSAGLSRPEWNQNQYGVMGSGPIRKEKAFFMGAWEGFSSRLGVPTNSGVPSYNMEQGIFKGQITDPTGNCDIPYDSASNTSTIPSSCFDSTAVSLFALFSTPSASNPDVTTLFTNPVAGNDTYQYTGRVDYNVSEKQRIFGRYTYWHVKDSSLQPYGETKINSGSAFSENFTHQAVLGDTYTLNSTTILDLRLSFLRNIYNNLPPTLGIDESQFGSGWAALSLQQSAHMIPLVHILGPDNLQAFFGPGVYASDTFNNYVVGASLLKTKGSHTLKFGTELRLMQDNGPTPSYINQGGSFMFLPNVAGDEFAGFLLGEYQNASITSAKAVSAFNRPQGYYVTDTWQATHNLTLNVGLRWELPGGINEKHDKQTVILPDTTDPVTGFNGAVVLVNSSLYKSRSALPVKHNLFSPRLSFAYRLDSHTVANGGYGLVYLPPDLNRYGTPADSPVNSAQTTINSTQYHALENPFGVLDGGSILQPTGRTPGFAAGYQGQVINSPVATNAFPYTQQWNLGVSRELKSDWMMEIGYAGSKGTHLPAMVSSSGTIGINELSSQYYSQGAALLDMTTWNGIAMTVGQSLRPYPYFQNLENSAAYSGSSTYNSMQVKSQKRFQNGSLLIGMYTWSKLIGDTDTTMSYLEPTSYSGTGQNGALGLPQDFRNPKGDRSVLGNDIPQRAVISYILNLPFGHGQKYASGVTGISDKVISGWAVNGITTFQSGTPLGIYENSGNELTLLFGGGTLRPNVVSGCKKNSLRVSLLQGDQQSMV